MPAKGRMSRLELLGLRGPKLHCGRTLPTLETVNFFELMVLSQAVNFSQIKFMSFLLHAVFRACLVPGL